MYSLVGREGRYTHVGEFRKGIPIRCLYNWEQISYMFCSLPIQGIPEKKKKRENGA